MQATRYEIESRDGTLIPVWKSGTGRSLILVHGAISDHTAWDLVRPELEPHFTVVAIDRRATFGDPSSRYDLEREFEDVAAVASAERGEVDILGHSSGAVCALGASLLTPNLRRLVLYEPPIVSHVPPVLANMEPLLAASDLEGALETFLRDAVRVPEATLAGLKGSPTWKDRVSGTRLLFREQLALAAWQPERQQFRSLAAPTLLLLGGATPRDHHHRGYASVLQGTVPQLTVSELSGQEHFAHVGAPTLFAEIVLGFLLDKETRVSQ
jgi:pimeloyl-ACP methyl ester carboxylesterase